MSQINIRILNRAQVEALQPDADELVSVVEAGLHAHGSGKTIMPPKSHLVLDELVNGHFNILSGYVEPIGRAGVKVIGDYVDNWQRRLPSEIALLTLYDPATGVPLCLMDATSLTWQRTGAVTCVGAKYLARRDSRVVTHLGARGTAFQNLKLLANEFDLAEIRIGSRRPESRERLAARIRDELGVRAVTIDDPAVASLYGAALVLVRPDAHVAWRGDDAAAPDAIIDRARGALVSDLMHQPGPRSVAAAVEASS